MYSLAADANTPKVILDNATHIGDVAWNSIDRLLASIVDRLPFILAGILVLILFWVIGKVIRSIFWATTARTKLDNRLRILFSRLIVVFVTVVGIFTAFSIIVPSFGFGDLIAGFGLTSFVIGFATKDILNNLLSGVLILWQQPFRIGDQIFIGNNAGKVEYIGIRATSLRKDDGELILIPNGDMYSSALTIRGAGAQRRMNLKFSIGYDEDLEQAKALTYEVLNNTEGIVKMPKPRVVVTDLTSDGATFTVNFWIDTNESQPLEVFDRAAISVVKALDGEKIELYPPGLLIVREPAATTEEDEADQPTLRKKDDI